MVALHVMPRLVNFGLQTPEIHATQNCLKKWHSWIVAMYVLFPFARCQHYHARTPYDAVKQSGGRCHFVAIAVDIQETAEDRTVCSALSIPPVASDTLLFTARVARTSFRFCLFCFVRCPSSLNIMPPYSASFNNKNNNNKVTEVRSRKWPSKVTQGHWKRYGSIKRMRFPITFLW